MTIDSIDKNNKTQNKRLNKISLDLKFS